MSLPATMNALVLNGDGFSSKPPAGELVLDDFVSYSQLPVPVPKPGQVLIKVRLASVNPSDEMFIQGLYGQPRVKGAAAGFEAVGDVVASGGGFLANRLKGKRVAFVATGSGTWAEYCLAEAAVCIPLRKTIRDEDGAAMVVNPLTAVAMFDLVKAEGEKAFVMSAAGSQLCKLIGDLAKAEGYRPIAIVRRENQAEIMKAHGAAHVLVQTAPDFTSKLRETCKAEKPRIFLDAVTGPLGGKVFKAMGKGARWIVYGRLDPSDTVIPEPGELIFLLKRIEGFWLPVWLRNASMFKKMAVIRQVQARFASGEWRTDVSAIVSLAEAAEKLVPALRMPDGKAFLKP